MKFCVAIDGPSAAGKGTIAKKIAHHFGFIHLDTGLLYRAVAFEVLTDTTKNPIDVAKTFHLDMIDKLGDKSVLRTPEIALKASEISKIPQVRAALFDIQKTACAHPQGAVLDGRDIGTVICPRANVKLFITARADIRAQRRYKQLRARDDNTLDSGATRDANKHPLVADYDTILHDLKQRDTNDKQRAIAPLKPSPDATVIDTSDMDITDACAQAISLVQAKL